MRSMGNLGCATALLAALVFWAAVGWAGADDKNYTAKDEQDWQGRLRDSTAINQADLYEILHLHKLWLKGNKKEGKQADLSGAGLSEATLWGADLSEADLSGANLFGADLSRIDLGEANLREADLRGTNLGEADLSGADLSGANLRRADLSGADLRGADLSGADLSLADVTEAIFETKAGIITNIPSMATTINLWTITYYDSPHGLVELRDAFKRAGMRQQERELTYAINHNRRLKEDEAIWSYAQWFLFEFPVGWGMNPGRPLLIMAGFIPVFAIVYFPPMGVGRWAGGAVWLRWRPERRVRRNELNHPQMLKRQTLKSQGLKRAGWALYFSILSAFHIGWRDLNVGNWISRMQPREYTLRARGWVRTVSGLQSLLSVYLLALAVLTYFGRPFE